MRNNYFHKAKKFLLFYIAITGLFIFIKSSSSHVFAANNQSLCNPRPDYSMQFNSDTLLKYDRKESDADPSDTSASSYNNSNTKSNLISTDYQNDYMFKLFETTDGLTSMEINAILQTNDGYIWAGGYSGLFKYNGVAFHKVNISEDINNVTALFQDSIGRLWIGTNDHGVICYNSETNECEEFNSGNGLDADSVRYISEDGNGNVYIATVGDLSVIQTDGTIVNLNNLENISYVIKLAYLPERDYMVGVTNSGTLFLLKDLELVSSSVFTLQPNTYYMNVCAIDENEILLGTSSSGIYLCNVDTLEQPQLLCETGEAVGINILYKDSQTGCIYVGAENDMGYLNDKNEYVSLATDSFHSSLSGMTLDHQGNLWFSSNKQGICKFSYNQFSDLFKAYGISGEIVNSVAGEGNLLYIGTDNGLILLDTLKNRQIIPSYQSYVENVRIRHTFIDSKGNLWLSTYGVDGLLCIDPDDNVTIYNESNGAMGSRFRSVIELQDHTILAASSVGLTYIKDGKIIGTIGEEDGLAIPQVLSMSEAEDGTIYIGSDGDGVYVIRDKKIADHIDNEDGLKSLVVLRIVPCKEGRIYVTSDALYYDNGTEITRLNNFPYSNNYDVLLYDDTRAWVSSSAGIYIVNFEDLIANDNYNYILVNNFRGFDTTLTANAWNYLDENGNYYLCCCNGVRVVNIPAFNQTKSDFNVLVDYITVDNDTEIGTVNNVYQVPDVTKRMVITPGILNYSLSDPLIHIYLEGFDEDGITAYQNELTDITYTNIPYGQYTLHVQVLDELSHEVIKETSVPIFKNAQFFEHTYFKIYLIIVMCFIVFFFTLLFSKYNSITIIKQQNEELSKAKDEADNANRAKSQFLANMSHEIRTPINAILGMNELVLREDVSDTVRNYSQDINIAGQSLLGIINDILDFSKIESGKMHLVESEYNTKEMITGVLTVLQINASQKGLNYHYTVDPEIPAILFGDQGRIRQILLNIISNAIKYTEKGAITFTVQVISKNDEKARLRFSVQDTGIGIKPEDRDKLFQNFERLDESRNRNIQGTGLGLSITARLLELMNSRLEFVSAYGKGSNFFFELEEKIIDAASIGRFNMLEEEQTREIYQPSFTASKASILLVDDNHMNLKVLEGLLRKTKIQITSVDNGPDAIRAVHDNSYDVVLLDHMMPDMDGIETLQQIQKLENYNPSLPIIALTANAISGAREEYLSAGFTDYLTKPIAGKDLEKALYNYISKDKIDNNGKNSKINNKDSLEKASPLIDKTTGLQYAGDDEEFYQQILEMYAEESEELKANLQASYQNKDWKNYAIYAHSLKSTSKGIGANQLYEEALELEKNAKENRESYIISHHDSVFALYEKVLNEIRNK